MSSRLVFEDVAEEERPVPVVLSSLVVYNGHKARLSYSQKDDRVSLTRLPKDSHSKSKVIFNVPTYVILNVETTKEKDSRQYMREANDDSIKSAYLSHQRNATAGLCGVSAEEENDEIVFAHSRVQTGVSTASGLSGSASSKPRKYFMYYVRLRNGQKKSILSLEFSSTTERLDGSEYVPVLETLKAILSRVYTRGVRNLLIFISPKSGKGESLKTYEKQVEPVLHFSRHVVRTHVTTRAHDCEDYIANIENPLDGTYVIVAAGGDGMVNEVVNGLHRRKVALIKKYQLDTVNARNSDPDEDGLIKPPQAHRDPAASVLPGPLHAHQRSISGQLMHGGPGEPTAENFLELYREGGWRAVMPLVATIPTGSACGLAKSLDVIGVTDSVLALVHLHSCSMDLMRMRFAPNPTLRENHASSFKRAKIERNYEKWVAAHKTELEERQLERAQKKHVAPFLRDGSGEFADAVSLAMDSPELEERIAFMSLSFGMANDVDHGSEKFRFLGNARFALYGGWMIACGPRFYETVLRYLPWESRDGVKLEKLHASEKMPTAEQFAPCTMRSSCPHCRAHRQRFPPESVFDENEVDFDDKSLPWVTIRGMFCITLLCNERDVAQDMMMAPLSHMSDGSIDIVFARPDPITGKGGRYEFVCFFAGLEKATHVDLGYTNYVKARAVEIQVNHGISMSDGEMMPLSTVRLTKMRSAIDFVRSE